MSKTQLYPARYTLRTLALIIDFMVVVLLLWLARSIENDYLYGMLGRLQAENLAKEEWDHLAYVRSTPVNLWREVINGLPLKVALALAYCTIFEQSAMRATPVKWLLGLRVVDEKNQPLDFWTSLKRNSLKVGLLFFPYILISYISDEFQPFLFFWLLLSLGLWINGSQEADKQMFYDRWLHTYVKVMR
ncbi:RDD family protein [Saprospira grandis]|uniref:RDD domain containing protein n=1 Tax=Saprospira grandis (strain Lewin) TaxID=984262 RepID=H6L090_SAPGL|nr:RDD family protein [Saprospira grandis]AFC26254.1 RDD domain containing protein [Saprospira grandis str. Lewin]